MKKKSAHSKTIYTEIKRKMFRIKLDRRIREGVKVNTNILRKLLLLSDKIGHPDSEEQKELLKKVIQAYDETVLKLEENLTYARMWIREGEEKDE